MNQNVNTNGQATAAPLEKAANKIIRKYTIAATGSGLIPVPVLSAAVITGIQVLMTKELCALFGVDFENQKASVLLNAALGSAATRVVSMAALVVPGISAPMKGLSGAAIAGVYTATVGEFYKVHFQNGGNLENASIRELASYFVDEYQRGDISLNSIANPRDMFQRMIG
ncbi:MAG: hypothetical protein AAGJ18_14550 [Bacteroidota bacterium]